MTPIFWLSAALAAAHPAPADFAEDVKLLFQVVSCQGGSLPESLDPRVIEGYCAQQKPRLERFKGHWGSKGRAFLAELRPKDAPTELVYPFGGGDLMMALTTFPEATVINTVSLELAGDPRRLRRVSDKNALKNSLSAIADASNSTLTSNDSKSVNLSKIQRGELPGQLSMHLIGLALFGYTPVAARYFRVEPSGALHYYTAAEIEALEGSPAERLRHGWTSPDFSQAFANVEVEFVSAEAPQGPRRIHRHFAADLSDAGLERLPGLMVHLGTKGKVSAMTKAASYLLWRNEFSKIRDYLVAHASVMISDSTGVPPRYWKAAGCAVSTYGTFQTSFLGTGATLQTELREEFKAQPRRALPMRFGYPDGSPERTSHLLLVTCPGAPQ